MKKRYDKFTRAKNIYENGLPDISYENLLFLAAYCRQELNYGDRRVEKKLIEYCRNCQEDFSEVISSDLLKIAIKYSKLVSLNDADFVEIYKHELEEILRIKDFKLQVFIFSSLVYLKAIYPNAKRFTVNIFSVKDILELSGMGISVKTFLNNHYFILKSMNMSHHNYGSDFFEIKISKKTGELVIKVSSFKKLKDVYIALVGSEFFFCKRCGERVEKKKHSRLMCPKCIIEVRRDKKNKWQINWNHGCV